MHSPLRSIRSVEEVAVEAEDVDDGVRRRERRRREVEAARVRVDLRRADVLDARGSATSAGWPAAAASASRTIGMTAWKSMRASALVRAHVHADKIDGQPRRVSGCTGEESDVSTRLTKRPVRG